MLPRPAPGADRSVGARLAMVGTVRGVRLPLSIDMLGFTIGQTEVGLGAVAVAQQFPADLESQLYSTLVQRARQDLAQATTTA
jgi:hypothetical protein